MKQLKHYYIIDGFVEASHVAYNPDFYKYGKLDDSQVEFYLKNPKASLTEIRNAKKDVK